MYSLISVLYADHVYCALLKRNSIVVKSIVPSDEMVTFLKFQSNIVQIQFITEGE